MKTVAAKSVEAFQHTEEYNTMLFSWYYKGFKLLQRFLIKNPTGIDLEELNLEAVHKEMAVDEATQMSQAIQDIVVAPEGDTSEPVDVDGRETAI